MIRVLSVPLLAALLFGCAATSGQQEAVRDSDGPIPDENEVCKADAVQYAIGRNADVETGRELLAASGARSIRWIPPNSAVTMDYRPDRMNISYDDDMVIIRISCG